MSVPNAAPAAAAAAPVTQEVQSNDEAIGSLARGFLGAIEKDEDPNQNPIDEALIEEGQPQAEAEAEEPQQEAETPALPEIPMVEVDIDGEKYTIPEKVKHRVMADKDYRQKTMEVAATKKQLEQLTATATQIAQQAQQLAPYHAQLYQVDARVNQLSQALQSPELAADPVSYNRVQGELAILLHQKGQLAQGLTQHTTNLTQQQQQLREKQLQLEAPKLFEEFPDLQKADTQQRLVKYIQDSGLPPEAMDYLNYSVPGAKLAWKAHQYDVMVKEQAASRAKLQAKVKDLPSATQSSRAANKGAQDKQLLEQWQKNGGKPTDAAFTQLLRSKIGR